MLKQERNLPPRNGPRSNINNIININNRSKNEIINRFSSDTHYINKNKGPNPYGK